MSKKRLYVDMDGVLANFAKAYAEEAGRSEYPQSNWGFFANLEPIAGGVEAVKLLMLDYEVWILTRASYKNPLCYTEKRIWIEKYFGLRFCNNLIICSNKSLVKGDYLIDDSLMDGQTEFEGEHIHFGFGKFPDWDAVLKYLMPYAFE